MILARLVPMVSAAWTNFRSFTEMAWPRTRRVYHGHQDNEMASTALFRLLPMRATMAMASSRGGKLRNTSVIRMITLSTQPPKLPAMAPRGTPMSRDRPTAASAAVRDTRAPYSTRLNRSRPSSSVPIQCAALGGWSFSAIWAASVKSSG